MTIHQVYILIVWNTSRASTLDGYMDSTRWLISIRNGGVFPVLVSSNSYLLFESLRQREAILL